MAASCEAWADADIAIIRQKWLDGYDDIDIVPLLSSTRTPLAIYAKRRAMKLMTAFYPDRPRRAKPPKPYNRGFRRVYTEAENKAILSSFESGLSTTEIAKHYDVNARAIQEKINRLLDQQFDPYQGLEPTERRCLCCLRMFSSTLPKSTCRRCPSCHEILRDAGTSFMTIY